MADQTAEAGDKFQKLTEQLKGLFAGLGDFAPDLPQDAAGREAALNDFAAYYAKKTKAAYTGKTPYENYALNVDGTLRENVANKAKATATVQFQNFRDEQKGPAQEPPIAPKSNGHDTQGQADEPELGGEQATPGHGAQAAAQDAPPPEPDIEEPAPSGETRAKGENTNEDHDGHIKAYDFEHRDASAHVRDYKNRPTDWSKIKSVFPAYADGPELKSGNGSATGADVRKVTNSQFFKFDYHILRQIAVYYGGFERDPKFLGAIEELARSNDMSVQELLNIAQREALDDSLPKTMVHAYIPEWAVVEGKRAKKPVLKDVTIAQAMTQAFASTSLLMTNPLESTGKDFELPLVGVGLLRKGFEDIAWRVNRHHVQRETGSDQWAFGSNVVFMDARKNGYKDNGERVQIYLAQNEKFGGYHAINMARIYFAGRFRSQPDGQPQIIKYNINSGVGMFRRSMGVFHWRHTRNRDLMILAALNEGKRGGFIPDMSVTGAFGVRIPVGQLDIKNMNGNALADFRAMGIDVGKLIDWHNENLRNRQPQVTPVIDGENAAPPGGTPPAGAAGGGDDYPTPPISPAGGGQTLSMADLAGMPAPELGEKLANGPVPPEQAAHYADLVKQAQLAARMRAFAQDPDSLAALPPLEADERDSEQTQNLAADLQYFQDKHAAGTLNGDDRVEASRLAGEASIKTAQDLEQMGLDDIAQDIKQAWNAKPTAATLKDAIENSDILMQDTGGNASGTQAPIVPKAVRPNASAKPAGPASPRA